MTENKRYVVITDIDLEVSLKDNITKKYLFSLVYENIDKFEPLLNEVINVCAELNKNWEQTLRFEDYNKELTQRSIKYEDTIDELKHENKELKGKASNWKITASEEIFEKEGLMKQIVELKEENKQLQQELFESEYENICERYHDNSIRRDSWVEDLKEEFKERFGRDFE